MASDLKFGDVIISDISEGDGYGNLSYTPGKSDLIEYKIPGKPYSQYGYASHSQNQKPTFSFEGFCFFTGFSQYTTWINAIEEKIKGEECIDDISCTLPDLESNSQTFTNCLITDFSVTEPVQKISTSHSNKTYFVEWKMTFQKVGE